MLGCSNQGNPETENPEQANLINNEKPENNKETKFKLLTFDKNSLSDEEISLAETKIAGNIIEGKRWEDSNGMNIIFFSKAITKNSPEILPPDGGTTIELHVYHYKKEGNKYKLVREVKDFEKNCGFENRANFVTQTIEVTDLDNDNFAEITFVYRLGCTSELSPDGLKLIMLENGEKYAIRGNTYVVYGENIPAVGGETNIDKNFDDAPKRFLENAKKIWNQSQKH